MTARDKRSAITLSTLGGEAEATADEIVCDLLAALTPELARPANAPHRAAIPGWLARARDALRECETAPDLAVIADEAGVHRVHLSRAFSRQFGVPPSLYRRRCRLARAIAEMLQGASLADAALSAGFADQSHFSRFAKTETGYSPHSLKTLLAAA